MKAPSTTQDKRSSSSPASWLFFSRKAWFFVALIIFIISTIFAFVQPTRRNPFNAEGFHGLRWFSRPIERNAFKRLPTITSRINDIFVVPGTRRIWIAGDGGLLAYSDDGGVHWEQQLMKKENTPQPEKEAKGAWILTPGFMSTAYAAAPSEQKSLNSEYNKQEAAQTNANPDVKQQGLLSQQPSESYPTEKTASEKSQDVRQKMPVQTSSGTTTSQTDKSPKNKTEAFLRDFKSIYFVDTKHGWIVGSGGTILYTVDEGKTWNPQTSGTNVSLFDMQFLDMNQGWAVGGGGTILHTVDGGKTWAPQTSGTDAALSDVQFLDMNQGWAVGEGGCESGGDEGRVLKFK